MGHSRTTKRQVTDASPEGKKRNLITESIIVADDNTIRVRRPINITDDQWAELKTGLEEVWGLLERVAGLSPEQQRELQLFLETRRPS